MLNFQNIYLPFKKIFRGQFKVQRSQNIPIDENTLAVCFVAFDLPKNFLNDMQAFDLLTI